MPVGRGAYVRARLALLGAVAAAHDCEIVWRTGPDGATGILAGFTSDLDATAVVYESLHLQATSRMAAERRATPAATQRWRRAFLFGFADRAGELLRETRRRVEADVVTSGAGSDAARPARARRPGPGVRLDGVRTRHDGVGAGAGRGERVPPRTRRRLVRRHRAVPPRRAAASSDPGRRERGAGGRRGADEGRTAAYAAEDAAFGGTDAEDERPIEDAGRAGRGG